MATFHALQVLQETMNAEVQQQVSQYSESLRNRLGQITSYKADFDAAFGGFVENQLPKDELYRQIEAKMTTKKKGGKVGGGGLLDKVEEKKDGPILPNVEVSKDDQLA